MGGYETTARFHARRRDRSARWLSDREPKLIDHQAMTSIANAEATHRLALLRGRSGGLGRDAATHAAVADAARTICVRVPIAAGQGSIRPTHYP